MQPLARQVKNGPVMGGCWSTMTRVPYCSCNGLGRVMRNSFFGSPSGSTTHGRRSDSAMRYALMLIVLCALTGCSGTPADLGITGPTAPVPPQEPDDSTIDRPGLPDPINGYGPSITPSTGGGRFYNYN